MIDRLEPNRVYYDRVQRRQAGGAFTARAECRFATQRAEGAAFTFTIQGGGGGGGGSRNRNRDPRRAIFRTNVPDHPLDVILSRAEAESITVSVLAYSDAEAQIAGKLLCLGLG